MLAATARPVAEGEAVLERQLRSVKMIVGDPVDGRDSDAGSHAHDGEMTDVKIEGGLIPGKRRREGPVDAAGAEQGLQAFGAHGRIAEREFLEAEAPLERPCTGGGVETPMGCHLAPRVGGRVGRQKRQRSLRHGVRAAVTADAHQGGDERVFPIAERFGGRAHSRAGRGRNARMAGQRQRDGRTRDAGAGGDLTHGYPRPGGRRRGSEGGKFCGHAGGEGEMGAMETARTRGR